MKKRYPKRVNPETMITRFEELFKPVGLKKPTARNLLFVLIAISVVRTFRISEIASRLPIIVAREKSKEKRFLRFLETPWHIDALKAAWFVSVVSWYFKAGNAYLYLLVSVTRRLPLHIGRRHIIVITEKVFLLLLLSNAFSRIYGTNTFLLPFSPRDTAEAIHSEFTEDDCFSHIQT